MSDEFRDDKVGMLTRKLHADASLLAEQTATIRQQAERIERLEQVGRELIKHLDIVGAEGSLIEEFRAALTTAAPEGPKETSNG